MATSLRLSQPQIQARASLNVAGKKSAARTIGVAQPTFAANAVRLSSRSNGIARAEKVAAQRTAPSAQRSSATIMAGIFDKKPKQKTVVITGASSGLGLYTTAEAIASGEWHVVMAVRNPEKMRKICEDNEFPKKSYTILEFEAGSLDSVRNFVKLFRKTKRTLDVLCCNAAIYLPNQPNNQPTFTEDGFEESLAVNHLSHFLLCNLMLPDLKKAKDPRCIIVGSITGNTNTVGGGAVKPFADLGDLKGLETGKTMIDGKGYNGAKAYKDSKLANMMTVLQLHDRFHEETGIAFTSMYPGCIAETQLFRQKRTWFRKFFPVFMKYVTGGYVSEEEAGERLFQCIAAPEASKSGVYWSWNGGARTVGVYDPKKKTVVGAGGAGGEIFENRPSLAVRDPKKGKKLWDLSMKAVGLAEDEAPKGKRGTKKLVVSV